MVQIKRGLFLNSFKSACSIYSSGQHIYDILKDSDKVNLDYSEEHNWNTIWSTSYDFIVYNQHFQVNNWLTRETINEFQGPVFCIVTEVAFIGDPHSRSPNWFTHYIVLDPSITETETVHAFPRPLLNIRTIDNVDDIKHDIPIIGSFGFAGAGKEWNKIVEAVEKDYDKAIIRVNIPYATHIPNNQQCIDAAFQSMRDAVTKQGISLNLTSEYMSEKDLVSWCSQNTLNCFIYYRAGIVGSGLSAVVDQAISAKRPILFSADPPFRHVHAYMQPYPIVGVKYAIEHHMKIVQQLAIEWDPQVFRMKFLSILFKCDES